jgi:hypothetical protein
MAQKPIQRPSERLSLQSDDMEEQLQATRFGTENFGFLRRCKTVGELAGILAFYLLQRRWNRRNSSLQRESFAKAKRRTV